MSDDYNFQKELEDSVLNHNGDKRLLVTTIFKSYVAKCLEHTLGHSKEEGRLPADALVQVMRNLVTEFRGANLDMYQKSEEEYAAIFDKTIGEILNDASLAHQGEDQFNIQSTLDINKDQYINEGGLYIPNRYSKQ